MGLHEFRGHFSEDSGLEGGSDIAEAVLEGDEGEQRAKNPPILPRGEDCGSPSKYHLTYIPVAQTL